MINWDNLQAIHLDVLKEIGNIGAGNAATSLAVMTGKKIDMDVPTAAIIDMQSLIKLIGDEEEVVICINLEVLGDSPSNVFFVIKENSALTLVDKLMGLPEGSYTSIDETAQSALSEIGNILTGSILSSMSMMTNLNMKPSVPALAHDMLGAVISAAMLETGYFDDRLLIIETRFFDESIAFDGYFFMLPHVGSLEKIFNSVGIEL
ncbi:chemotaxis protein CheC [Desulfonispora thiosulfatigenes DSM 11270]|uniref:Chemotaxis protein CheC n=1 Tax=Desulfonispora thiosulfatigenes DSM 11270 TaxID=656914 RepID=A0A1W1UNG1_DESTI|nr:chemotaxis protein CheC [Desulfonispora thiosulfatigenes]SMB82254.1 chemotaxis protein CheC [Desulfonispora thiosulfatigenes DSM 11270]